MMQVNDIAGTRVLMLLENDCFPQDNRVYLEATTLVEAGLRVAVICPRKSGQAWQEMLDGVRVYRYPAPPTVNGFLGYAWEYGYSTLAAFLLSFVALFRDGFDVIHAHNPPDTYVLVGAFYKLFGKRFVYDHHDLSPEMYHARLRGGGSRLLYHLLAFLEKQSCRLADHIVATNESYKAMEMQRSRVPEDRISVVRNGPDLKRLQRVEPDASLRQRAGTILGYVGIMGFQDGIDYLLRSLRHLIHDLDCRDFYCVLIGNGPALASLQALVVDLGLDQHVWFTGFVPEADLVRYLSSVDIFLDPDPSNPFNDRSTMIKMMEYMAMSRPTVAFDLPEHRVTAGEAAVYARANDELDFARKILQLMNAPEQRATMGRFGRQRVETELAWVYQKQNLLNAYAKLTTGKGLSNQLDRRTDTPARREGRDSAQEAGHVKCQSDG
jgi:glycosyltransferase involved in cell wall biosynthesis